MPPFASGPRAAATDGHARESFAVGRERSDQEDAGRGSPRAQRRDLGERPRPRGRRKAPRTPRRRLSAATARGLREGSRRSRGPSAAARAKTSRPRATTASESGTPPPAMAVARLRSRINTLVTGSGTILHGTGARARRIAAVAASICRRIESSVPDEARPPAFLREHALPERQERDEDPARPPPEQVEDDERGQPPEPVQPLGRFEREAWGHRSAHRWH